MSSYNLDVFFKPRNVAIIGASTRAGSIGQAIVRNMMAGKYQDKLILVNPRGGDFDGLPVFRSVSEIEGRPDLAIVAVAPSLVPEVMEDLGQKGCRGVIVITTSLGNGSRSLKQQIAEIADKYRMRLIGPNSMGVLAPRAGLNGSFCHSGGLPGDLALISQSGAVVSSVVDWASRNQIGFTAAVSLGDKADVDLADLMDYFAMDLHTRAILLYVESIRDARKFLSSARAAARTKPVLLMKSGRHAEGVSAYAWRNDALAGEDAVYDAAFERTGLLRVHDLDEFFDAAETLTHVRKLNGSNLTIVSNGTGLTALAADDLVDLGGKLSELSDEIIERLDEILPENWSRTNPVNIVGDATPERYKAALEILMEDRRSHAILVMHCPTALTTPEETAKAVIELLAERKKAGRRRLPVFAAWLGGGEVVAKLFEDADIPHYPTPSDAIRGFSYVVKHMQAQSQLMRMPPALDDYVPDLEAARAVINQVIAEGRQSLTQVEVSRLLEAYDLPISPSIPAETAIEAAQLAAPLITRHGAVVVKIDSCDIRFKSDIGGVVLDLGNTGAVATAAQQVLDRAKAAYPDANIRGVTLHPMVRKPHAVELIAGMMVDQVFGPVMVFGRGGTAVEVIRDKALALPPLDMLSAMDMIEKTRVNRRLTGYRGTAPVDRKPIAEVLTKMSRMVADLPEIEELDFNPLLADKDGLVITDAGVRIESATLEGVHPSSSGSRSSPIRRIGSNRSSSRMAAWCSCVPCGRRTNPCFLPSLTRSPMTTCGCASSHRPAH